MRHYLVYQSGRKRLVSSKALQLDQPVLQLYSFVLHIHSLQHFTSRRLFLENVDELLEYVREEDKATEHEHYHQKFFFVCDRKEISVTDFG